MDKRFFSFFQSIQTSSGTHLASYSLDNGDSFSTCKTARVWRWPFTFIYSRSYEWVELHIHSPTCLYDIQRDKFKFSMPHTNREMILWHWILGYITKMVVLFVYQTKQKTRNFIPFPKGNKLSYSIPTQKSTHRWSYHLTDCCCDAVLPGLT
jgi:hypothetical protein